MTRLVLAALALPCAGCLERHISVTSRPEGAIVWINDQEVGRTPVEAGFMFYGTFDVRVRKEGCEPVAGPRDVNAPWYEYPGPDLIASALPWTIRNTVRWHYDLAPTPAEDEGTRAALLERAAELRDRLGALPAP